MRFLEIVLDYEDFKVFRDKETRQYFALEDQNNGEYDWYEVELCGVVEDCGKYTVEELLEKCNNYDLSGEDFYSEDYLFFREKIQDIK